MQTNEGIVKKCETVSLEIHVEAVLDDVRLKSFEFQLKQ